MSRIVAVLVGVLALAWSWHHGRFDGQTLAVVLGLLAAAAVLALRDIDSQNTDRLADPTPRVGDRD